MFHGSFSVRVKQIDEISWSILIANVLILIKGADTHSKGKDYIKKNKYYVIFNKTT